ncbi:Group IIE secretory phospholipase A2, partial [Tyto alba]
LTLTNCNLVQFGSMIRHKTGKSPLSYNGYGCYCGIGGSKQPVDETDLCCHAHDCCYKKLSTSRCLPKLVTYKYHTFGDQLICEAGNSCQRQTCECDKQAAECFQRAAVTYSSIYKNYFRRKCKGQTPSC